MRIQHFEEIEAWQLARDLTRTVYKLTKNTHFSKDFSLTRQIQDAAGSAMHNIADGYDAESNTEFIRFLRYAKRSCSEVQSQLYVAIDQNYITPEEFEQTYNHAGRTRAAIKGFITYLKNHTQKSNNPTTPTF